MHDDLYTVISKISFLYKNKDYTKIIEYIESLNLTKEEKQLINVILKDKKIDFDILLDAQYDDNLQIKNEDLYDKHNEIELFYKLNSPTISKQEKKKIRDCIIVSNINLTHYCINFFFKNNKNYSDLLSYAYEGLIYAVDKFNPDMNYNFSTYAVNCIKGYIYTSIPYERNIPRNLYYNFYRAQKIIENKFDEEYTCGNQKMLNDILDLLYSLNLISECQKIELYNCEMINGANTNSIENIYYEDGEKGYHNIFMNEVGEYIKKSLKLLTPKQLAVISLLYGKEYYSVTETAKILKISGTRVIQQKQVALRKIRKYLVEYANITNYAESEYIINPLNNSHIEDCDENDYENNQGYAYTLEEYKEFKRRLKS